MTINTFLYSIIDTQKVILHSVRFFAHQSNSVEMISYKNIHTLLSEEIFWHKNWILMFSHLFGA